jgi:ethanolamine ammonia-lyase small subunit
VLFVRYCRVGASDHIGSLTEAELVCMLVGERPGLATAESMSAYITYGARIGVSESQRTVVSNIHRGGTPAAEAGAQIAGLIESMLRHRTSGVALKAKLAVGQ